MAKKKANKTSYIKTIKMNHLYHPNSNMTLSTLSMDISLRSQLNGVISTFRRSTSTDPEDAEDVHRRDAMSPCKPQGGRIWVATNDDFSWVFNMFQNIQDEVTKQEARSNMKQQRKP